MNKKSDEEFGILITREMKAMMLDSTISYEDRAKIFCSIIGSEELENSMMKAFAASLRVGFISTNNKRKAEILSRRDRQRNYQRNLRSSTEIGVDERTSTEIDANGITSTEIGVDERTSTHIYGDRRASLNKAKQSKARQSKAKHNIPPKSPGGGLNGENPSDDHLPSSVMDNPEAALNLPTGTDAVAVIAAKIEAEYPHKVNPAKLRKSLVSVLKKNSAAEVLEGFRKWLEVWQADDFQWAPSRITDWLYDGKFLEEPRRGARRAQPTVDPDTVANEASMPTFD